MTEAMSAVYLLNNQYPPFYKWMYRGLENLPILGEEIAGHLNRLLTSQCKQTEVEEICEMLICEFHNQGISDEQDFYMGTQAENIHAHISLEALRNSNPWAA